MYLSISCHQNRSFLNKSSQWACLVRTGQHVHGTDDIFKGVSGSRILFILEVVFSVNGSFINLVFGKDGEIPLLFLLLVVPDG
jgi:hypothetical protein